MGQGSTRTAIYNALSTAVSDGTIPLVGKIYPAAAYMTETDFELNTAGDYISSINGSGAVLVVNLVTPDRRERIALTGRNAQYDMLIHPICIEIYFGSTNGEPVPAQEDYDTIIDALVPFIRQNPTMSAPADIWSAGEYKAGVVHRQAPAATGPDGRTVIIYGGVFFEAWEQIVG